MAKTIFLIRHAEPIRKDDQKRYLGGLSDPDLSPVGRDQAEQLSKALQKENIRAIFTSDLHRAENTAALIAEEHDCEVIKNRAFREIAMGAWEGKSHLEIKESYPEEYTRRGSDLANFRPLGGESFRDLQLRVLPAFTEAVNHTEGNLVMVAHAGVNRVILCHLMARPLQDLFTIEQKYAAVNIIRESAGSCHVLGVNLSADNLTIGYHYLKEIHDTIRNQEDVL